MGFQHIAKKQIIRIAGTVFYPPLLAGELSRDGGCTVAISDGYNQKLILHVCSLSSSWHS